MWVPWRVGVPPPSHTDHKDYRKFSRESLWLKLYSLLAFWEGGHTQRYRYVEIHFGHLILTHPLARASKTGWSQPANPQRGSAVSNQKRCASLTFFVEKSTWMEFLIYQLGGPELPSKHRCTTTHRYSSMCQRIPNLYALTQLIKLILHSCENMPFPKPHWRSPTTLTQ